MEPLIIWTAAILWILMSISTTYLLAARHRRSLDFTLLDLICYGIFCAVLGPVILLVVGIGWVIMTIPDVVIWRRK